ncbi:MAG: thioredoxin family protein [Thermoleophilia bacterium]
MSTDRDSPTSASSGRRYQIVLIAAVIVVFAIIIGSKMLGPDSGLGGMGDAPSQSRADAVATFEQARASGRPVFLLFHSLTCDPCVEISANVDQVIPGYQGKVEFVNAITDDASGQQLAAGFNFQYIPTAFFFDAQGALIGSYTGVLSVDELRARLDGMVTQ